MKETLCVGQLPSGKFGTNTPYWMMILTFYLTDKKKLVFPRKCMGSKMNKIRFWVINI